MLIKANDAGLSEFCLWKNCCILGAVRGRCRDDWWYEMESRRLSQLSSRLRSPASDARTPNDRLVHVRS